MSQLQLQLTDRRTTFSPGETVSGTAGWRLDEAPKKAELCLVWSTRGKGTEDLAIVTSVPFDGPQASDHRPFTSSFRLRLILSPASSFRFSGRSN